MLYRARDAFNRWKLDRTLRQVLEAPPVVLDPGSGFAVLSQIQQKDLFMYLVAVKSFSHFLAPRKVHLLVDGDLSPANRELLDAHIPGVAIHRHTEYRDPRCPSGGTWERLLGLANHSAKSYMIQLDADTVTLAPLPEVEQSIATATAFTLGSRLGQAIEPSEATAARAKGWLSEGSSHIQITAESVLDQFSAPDGVASPVYYVRGCSGFTGIPRGALSSDRVAAWSQAMAPLVGTRWSEWGSEQFMSNLLIANMDTPTVLPHLRYPTCPKSNEEAGAIFAHMAGFCRYSDRRYARFAERAMASAREVRPG